VLVYIYIYINKYIIKKKKKKRKRQIGVAPWPVWGWSKHPHGSATPKRPKKGFWAFGVAGPPQGPRVASATLIWPVGGGRSHPLGHEGGSTTPRLAVGVAALSFYFFLFFFFFLKKYNLNAQNNAVLGWDGCKSFGHFWNFKWTE
jgi:hypothetical protein